MSIDEVRALVAERQRYDEWLSALEARRAETPERVFARVHGDYAQRRGEVLAQLHTHVDALSVLGGELAERLAGLDRDLESLEDQRVEAMLRTAVGEYDTQRADSLREDVEAQLARLTDERGSVHMELDDIRALLEQATPAREATPVSVAAVVPEVVAEPVPTPLVQVAEAPAVEAAAADDAADVAAEALTDSADASPEVAADAAPAAVEAAAKQAITPADAPTSIFGDAHEGARAAVSDDAPEIPQFVEDRVEAAPSASVPTPVVVDATEAQVDDALRLFAETPAHPTAVIAPLHDPVDFTTPSLPPVASTPTFGAPPVPSAPVPSAPAPSAPAASAPSAADPFDDLAFLRSVIEPEGGAPFAASAPDAAFYVPPAAPASAASSNASSSAAANSDAPQKTLRCTECGTMNLPTEWYCERCGGELATF